MAELAEEFYRDSDNALDPGRTDKNVAQFKELPSHRLRSMVVGQFAADANAPCKRPPSATRR
ncbi:MAG: hypothetical protein R3A10_02850 [Caldilineaceae bacterium]